MSPPLLSFTSTTHHSLISCPIFCLSLLLASVHREMDSTDIYPADTRQDFTAGGSSDSSGNREVNGKAEHQHSPAQARVFISEQQIKRPQVPNMGQTQAVVTDVFYVLLVFNFLVLFPLRQCFSM